MRCLKCGREIDDAQVFCPDCLKEMEKYPVPPDISVQLPSRKAETVVRHPPKRQRRTMKPEEMIRHQKNQIHSLSVALALVVLIFGMCLTAFTIYFFRDDQIPVTGQNYRSSDMQEITDITIGE